MAQASSIRAGRTKRLAIVFDSSFLVAVMQHPTPWREDITEKVGAFTPVVLDSVRQELSRLAASNTKKGRFAGLALQLLTNAGFSLEKDGGGKPDQEIVSFALREGAGVATLDSELAERLRASRVRLVIGLRSGRVST